MSGHTKWSDLKHKRIPWYRLDTRFRVWRYRRELRKHS
jgi:hypothetical protein